MSLIRPLAFGLLALPVIAESSCSIILRLIADDFGPHFGYDGTKEVTTPVLDAMRQKACAARAFTRRLDAAIRSEADQ
jgi:hypothetical protein